MKLVINMVEFFPQNEIGKYSSKIKFICDQIKKSEGIILIFSQYIDGGCIPMALALEEIGITRVGNKNLFKTPPTKKIDALTKKSNNIEHPAQYIMITGDKLLSPNNDKEIKIATKDNVNGEKVKVIIISEAGSEGIDLQNIRQVHILEPWYNLNRIEQIIGRAVRNCSHKELPFKKRNVEILMYGTQLINTEMEAADMYVYRLAERKSMKIGQISRILKEISVDCLLNKNVMTQSKMNQEKKIQLSSGREIDFKIGDKPYSFICDYMKQCNYSCIPTKDKLDINEDTFNETFIVMNIEIVTNKIKSLFKTQYVYSKDDIIKYINRVKQYPLVQIDMALSILVNEQNEFVYDLLGRRGTIVNIGKYYMFQPIELTNKHQSYYDRIKPIDVKHNNILIKLPTKIKKITDNLETILDEIKNNYNLSQKVQKIKLGTKEINWFMAAGNAYDRLKNIIKQNNLIHM